jgi:hypothetical protein
VKTDNGQHRERAQPVNIGTVINVKLAQQAPITLARLRERAGERETGIAGLIIMSVNFAMPVRMSQMRLFGWDGKRIHGLKPDQCCFIRRSR